MEGRYEIPVPLKQDIVQNLPNNYDYALKRFSSMKANVARNPTLKQTLFNTFNELIEERWIVPLSADGNALKKPAWYLTFFVTKQVKPRVVYDGTAVVSGASLNQAVLSGINLLNDLVEVLTRFRLDKYACMADLSKCFFQVAMSEEQRDLFRIIWFVDNNFAKGQLQVFRFTRHVWGINSSSYVALCAIKHILLENPTNVDNKTLTAISENRTWMTFSLLQTLCKNLRLYHVSLLNFLIVVGLNCANGFTNSCASSILSHIPKCDLAISVNEIVIGSEPMPDSKALGVIWDVENDKLKVSFDKSCVDVTTRRQMASQLARNFDPLGLASPCLLRGKLILQNVAAAKLDWNDKLPENLVSEWNAWVNSLRELSWISIERYCFAIGETLNIADKVIYQLHGLCDASDNALSCVVYLRRIANGRATWSFILGKSRVVLSHQSNWIVSRKELEDAKICSE